MAVTCCPPFAMARQCRARIYLFFGSETPIKGHYNLTAFNDHWKLVQEIVNGLSSVDVTNYLFRIGDDSL